MGKVEANKLDFRIVPAPQYLVPEQRELTVARCLGLTFTWL